MKVVSRNALSSIWLLGGVYCRWQYMPPKEIEPYNLLDCYEYVFNKLFALK